MKNIFSGVHPVYYAFAIFLVLMPAITPFAVRSVTILFPLTAVVGFIIFLVREKQSPFSRLSISSVWYYVAAFLLYGLLSYFWSLYPDDVITRFIKLIVPLGSLFLVMQVHQAMQKKGYAIPFQLYAYAIFAGVVVGAVGLFIRHLQAVSLEDYFYNVTSIYVNNKTESVAQITKPFTLLMAFIIPFIWASALLFGHKVKILSVYVISFLTLLCLLLIMPTKDVLAGLLIIGLFIVCMMSAFIFPWNRLFLRVATLGMVGGAVMIICFVALFSQTVLDKYYVSFPSSVISRVEIWDLTIDRTKEKPVFGWGLDSYQTMEDRGEKSYLYPKPTSILHIHPHNGVIQVIYELGVVGLGLVLGGMIALARFLSHYRGQGIWFRLVVVQMVMAYASTLVSFGVWQGWLVATLCISTWLGWIILQSGGAGHKERSL